MSDVHNDSFTPADETVQATPPVLAPPDPVVEGASSTSSREANTSGPAAYIIFAIVAALIVVMGTSAFNALTSFIATLTPELEGIEYQVETLPNGEGLNITIPPDSNSGDTQDGTGTTPSLPGGLDGDLGDDSFDFEQYLYGDPADIGDPFTIEEALERSYSFESGGITEAIKLDANPTGDAALVSQFAETLAEVDKRHNDEAIKIFSEARANPSQAKAKLEELQALCEKAQDEIEAIGIPTDFASKNSAEIKNMLRNAKRDAEGRWDAIDSLCDVIMNPEYQTTEDLDFYDENVSWSTDFVAEGLDFALESANNAANAN